jgi:acetyl-CoA carboxylase biotin carboxyl carrier protein
MGMAANSGSGPGDVFDVKKVRKFIELMNEHDLSEIDLRQGDQRIRLRRGPETVAVATSPPFSTHTMPAVPVSQGASPSAAATEEAKGVLIRSPMVGTFYAAADPESPPFVKIGDQVGPETRVCIIEAMKVFNELTAECSGKIVAVLVENGAAVEFNQPLFRVEPNA